MKSYFNLQQNLILGNKAINFEEQKSEYNSVKAVAQNSASIPIPSIQNYATKQMSLPRSGSSAMAPAVKQITNSVPIPLQQENVGKTQTRLEKENGGKVKANKTEYRKEKPKETEFKSFNDLLSHFEQNKKENGEKVKANKTVYNLGSSVNRLNPEPNETLSRYKSEFKELEHIGGGSFGKVYKVINCLDRQQYAMKIILLRGIKDITRVSQGVGAGRV
jgi:hypothetical protein